MFDVLQKSQYSIQINWKSTGGDQSDVMLFEYMNEMILIKWTLVYEVVFWQLMYLSKNKIIPTWLYTVY